MGKSITKSNKKGHGTDDIGFHNSSGSIDLETLKEIRKLLKLGWTHQKISDKFGIGRSTVTRISLGMGYKDQGL